MSRYPRRSTRNRDERSHHPNQRRFARPIRPQQPKYLRFFNRKRNIVDRRELAISFHDMFHFNRISGVGRHVTAQAKLRSRDTQAIRCARGVSISLVLFIGHEIHL